MKDIGKFKEDIQNILDKFEFSGEARRKFFSQLGAATQRKAIKNDNNR